MSSNSFLIRIHRRLLTFWLLCIFIHYLLIKWWFRSLLFLIRYLLFFRLIGPSNEKTLNLMIILLVPEDLPHYLILVAIWNFILPMLPSTADSWVGTLPRFSTFHERPILFVRRLRLNWRLIIFSIPTSSRHLIDNTKAFLSELRMVFGRRSTPCTSWCLWLLLSLGIVVGRAGWKPGLFEISSKQNRLIFPCLVT
jgi:hypothetical protein